MDATLLLGIGVEARGDDGAGLAVVRRVARRGVPGWTLDLALGEASGLLARWEGWQRVVVVDAARAAQPPGTWLCLDATDPRLVTARGASTHGQGLAEAVRLARVLDRLPAELVLLAICGGCFERGAGLSAPVAAAVARLAARLATGTLPAPGVTPPALQGDGDDEAIDA